MQMANVSSSMLSSFLSTFLSKQDISLQKRMKTAEEIYEESLKYVWFLRIYDRDSNSYSYTNGFYLEDNYIGSSTFSYASFNVVVKARRVDEDKDEFNHTFKLCYVDQALGIAFLKDLDVSPSEDFGKLMVDECLKEGEIIYTTTSYKDRFPDRIGVFGVGTVAFPVSNPVTQPTKSDERCAKYVIPIDSEVIKPPKNRIMGHIINKISLDRWKKDHPVYEILIHKLGLLLHSLPIIQCNRLPMDPRLGAGSPVINHDGLIVGMSIGGFDSYVIAIRACTIQSSLELAKSNVKKYYATKLERKTELAKRKFEKKKEDDDKDRETKRQKTRPEGQSSHLVQSGTCSWNSLLTHKTLGQSSQLPSTDVPKNDKDQLISILCVKSKNQENFVNFFWRNDRNFARVVSRSGRSHTSVDLAEIIRCWPHSFQRIHKQALQLTKENNGDRTEFLQKTPDDSSAGYAEELPEILCKHGHHLASIQVLKNQLKDVATAIQISITKLTKEVDSFSSKLPQPILAQSSGCSSNAISDLASRLSAVQVDKVSSSRSTSKLSPKH